MQQSQTIERPGDPLLEACHPGMFEALLEQRAHPRIRALIGVREEGERKAYEWVDEAVLIASFLEQGQAFLDQGDGQRSVAARRADQTQSLEGSPPTSYVVVPPR